MNEKKDIYPIINPIDQDQVAEKPGLIPYAHHLGSAIIAPIDQGKTTGLAMSAMYEQTEVQLVQIKEQIDVLVRQAKHIHQRIELSEIIYQASIPFEPIAGRDYHLYKKRAEALPVPGGTN